MDCRLDSDSNFQFIFFTWGQVIHSTTQRLRMPPESIASKGGCPSRRHEFCCFNDAPSSEYHNHSESHWITYKLSVQWNNGRNVEGITLANAFRNLIWWLIIRSCLSNLHIDTSPLQFFRSCPLLVQFFHGADCTMTDESLFVNSLVPQSNRMINPMRSWPLFSSLAKRTEPPMRSQFPPKWSCNEHELHTMLQSLEVTSGGLILSSKQIRSLEYRLNSGNSYEMCPNLRNFTVQFSSCGLFNHLLLIFQKCCLSHR